MRGRIVSIDRCRLVLQAPRGGDPPLCCDSYGWLRPTSCHSGAPSAARRARNPVVTGWGYWVPGSLATLGPRNDERGARRLNHVRLVTSGGRALALFPEKLDKLTGGQSETAACAVACFPFDGPAPRTQNLPPLLVAEARATSDLVTQLFGRAVVHDSHHGGDRHARLSVASKNDSY